MITVCFITCQFLKPTPCCMWRSKPSGHTGQQHYSPIIKYTRHRAVPQAYFWVALIRRVGSVSLKLHWLSLVVSPICKLLARFQDTSSKLVHTVRFSTSSPQHLWPQLLIASSSGKGVDSTYQSSAMYIRMQVWSLPGTHKRKEQATVFIIYLMLCPYLEAYFIARSKFHLEALAGYLFLLNSLVLL